MRLCLSRGLPRDRPGGHFVKPSLWAGEERLRNLMRLHIVVGGVAAIVHGSARLTQDLDIVYRRTPDNMAVLRLC